jgi:hypothetical protein
LASVGFLEQPQEVDRMHLISVVIPLLATSAIGGAVLAQDPDRWAWVRGDEAASIGRPLGQPNLVLRADGDINLRAGHVRLMADTGAFRLEIGRHASYGRINAYYIGTAQRTPVVVGAPDGQDVTSLVVQGSARQRRDLQQWMTGERVVAAIDPEGRLRLGGVTIDVELVDGRVILAAVLPDGMRQRLAVGKPVP